MAKEAMIPRANRTTVNAEFEAVDAHLSEYVVNVSRTGALIRSKDPLPVGTRVNLRFSILLDEIEIVEGVAEVVRIETAPPAMGVVFRRLSESSARLLERLEQSGGTSR
ncbi:MAG: PilZ domain-containing protein [Deltaproteobacteria bacterium]|jgi:hypothetical protein|nr:PilZ domain-containing protein [Deltaproteobacteria bacterium]